MKKQNKDKRALRLSSTQRDSVRVYDDCQRAMTEVCPGNTHAMENGVPSQGHQGLDQVNSRDDRGRGSSLMDVGANGRVPADRKDQKVLLKDSPSTLMCDTTSQACSGPEDNSTEAHETLTETSTLTFVDAHTIDDSGEMHSLLGAEVLHIKEFVLIDDDDDGDMSLREKTVTDMSIMDGNAADLVCGRLLSTSSCSLFASKDESSFTQPPPPTETITTETPAKKKRCCLCAIL